jgi:uncharacterized integral membrane protein
MPPQVRKIVGWSLLGLLGLFIILNLERVTINFWWLAEVRLPVAVVLFLAGGMGAGAVLALQYFRDHRKDKPPPG